MYGSVEARHAVHKRVKELHKLLYLGTASCITLCHWLYIHENSCNCIFILWGGCVVHLYSMFRSNYTAIPRGHFAGIENPIPEDRIVKLVHAKQWKKKRMGETKRIGQWWLLSCWLVLTPDATGVKKETIVNGPTSPRMGMFYGPPL